MSAPILAKINVLKIDKTKLFKGEKGTYLDIVLQPNKNGTDQYGNDFMVVQGTSKEDRDAGRRGEILGNGRFLQRQGAAPAAAKPVPPPPEDAGDDLPF